MEKFSLDKWLQDKSRKVVTRDGKQVRIVCWDSPNKGFPIVGFIDDNSPIFVWDKYGYALSGHRESNCDLYFADNDGLTEFEKTMIQFSHERNSLIQFEHTKEEINAHLYRYSKKLLDLARKEICLTCKEYSRGYKEGLKLGREDILKDLPKWKKANEHKDLEKHIAILEEDKVLLSNYLEEGDYYIELDDLKTLPKEE